ncbi:MAG: transporter substrate-binding domain-containing protein [Pseudomonadota bacterium]
MRSTPASRPTRARWARAWLGVAGLLLTLSSALAAERPVLVLNDVNEPPYTTPDGNGFLDVIAREAFRRAGVDLKLVKLPAERGLINANAGIEDGDLVRIAGLEKQYPNLIRVPEKLTDWVFVAFSKDRTIPANWTAIRQRAVGHVKGWKIYERAVNGAERVTTVDDPEQLFRLLELGRIEVALYERWLGLALARKLGLKDVRPLSPPLARREMFIYLHKRHAALVPKIAEALRALKREGFYERAYREKLKPLREDKTP